MTQTPRQKLGSVIAFHLSKQSKRDHDVAVRCGVADKVVEQWRSGSAVPDRQQWKKLCGLVARSLYDCTSTYNDALRDQDAERDSIVQGLRRNGHNQVIGGKVVTNFGDKLIEAATVAAVPVAPVSVVEAKAEDASSSKRRYTPRPARPARATMPEAIAERMEFARSILMQRPKISSRGEDGLIALLQKRFGVGLSDGNLTRLRDEVLRDSVAREIRSHAQPALSVQAAQPVTHPATDPSPVATKQVNDVDVSAGVELIVGAIPGLQSMTITIGDDGVASVSWDVRQVQVTTVSSSLTVRR